MIKALAHLCVFTKDLARTRDFYCNTLGLTPHFEFHKNGELFGFYLQIAPRQFIEFFKTAPETQYAAQRIHHFCFEVDDIDAISNKLKKAGVEVTPKKLGCDQT